MKLFCWLFFLPVEKEPTDAKSAWSELDELAVYPDSISSSKVESLRPFSERSGESSVEPLTSLDAITGEHRCEESWMTEVASSNVPEQVGFDATEGRHMDVSNDEVVVLEDPHDQVAAPVMCYSKDLEMQAQAMESLFSELVLSPDSDLTSEVESFNEDNYGKAHSLTESVIPLEIADQFSKVEILHPSQPFHAVVTCSGDVEEQAGLLKDCATVEVDVNDSLAQRRLPEDLSLEPESLSLKPERLSFQSEGLSLELFPSHSVDLPVGVVDQLSDQESCKIFKVESDFQQVQKKTKESRTTELIQSRVEHVLEYLEEVDDHTINPISESADSLLLAEKALHTSRVSELLTSHEFPDLEGMPEENVNSCHIDEVNTDLVNAHLRTQECFISELVPSHAIDDLVDVKEQTVNADKISEDQHGLTEAHRYTLDCFTIEGVVNCQISEVSDDLINEMRQWQESLAFEQLLSHETTAFADIKEESGDSCQVCEVTDNLIKGKTKVEEHFTSELISSRGYSPLKDNEEEIVSSCNIGEVDIDVAEAFQYVEENFVSELVSSRAGDHLKEDGLLLDASQEFCSIRDVTDEFLKAEEETREGLAGETVATVDSVDSVVETSGDRFEAMQGTSPFSSQSPFDISRSAQEMETEILEETGTVSLPSTSEVKSSDMRIANVENVQSFGCVWDAEDVSTEELLWGRVEASKGVRIRDRDDADEISFDDGDFEVVEAVEMTHPDVEGEISMAKMFVYAEGVTAFESHERNVIVNVAEQEEADMKVVQKDGGNDSSLGEFVREESSSAVDVVVAIGDEMGSAVFTNMEISFVEQHLKDQEMEDLVKHDDLATATPDDVDDSAQKPHEREELAKGDGHLSVNLDASRNEMKSVCIVEANRSPSYPEGYDVQVPGHGSDAILTTEAKGIYMHAAEMMVVLACNIGNQRCVTKYGFRCIVRSDSLLPALTLRIIHSCKLTINLY